MDALTIPRRDAATYVMDSRERYKDTGRDVDERYGTITSGATVNLPHHCLAIPAEVHAAAAPDTVLARPEVDAA